MSHNKVYYLWTIILFIVLLVSKSAYAEKSNRPNVVLFYADDLGWGDLGVYHGKTPTPNIDRIFNSGIRFGNFSTHCVCSPSRAGILTGRHYIKVNAGPETGGELALNETTMAESFKAAGYATGAFGKWHNGAPTSYGGYEGEKKYSLGSGVNAHGFDRFVGYYGGGWDYFTRYSIMYKQVVWYHDLTNMPDEKGYTTDLITKYVLQFLEKNKDKSFFCYVPHEAMHAPYQAKYEDILRVPEEVRQGIPLLSKEEYEKYFLVQDAWTKLPKEQLPIVYSAMLLSLDDSIGNILNWLEKEGLLENTIIMFASDNGATKVGNNLPLRGGKHTMYEGGIRVPAAMWWENGKLTGGKTFEGDFGYLDVYPTLCSLAGIKRQQGLPLDGRDLSSAILSGKKNPSTLHHWVWMREGVTCNGRWKLIYNLEDMQLYDLQNDLEETSNLAAEKPEIVSLLKQTHEKWLKEVKCNPAYAVPFVDKNVKAAPEGEVLEFYAEQTAHILSPQKGLSFIFASGYGDEYKDPVLPGDVIEYDICVAKDSCLDGFFYTPSSGWEPIFLTNTGYDQYGRLQTRGPAPKGGRGIWEHRVVGIGQKCPHRMPFNIISMSNREPTTYHFYMDNLVVRKPDGRIIDMWKDSSHTFKRWNEQPFMLTPNHTAFKNIKLQAVSLNVAE